MLGKHLQYRFAGEKFEYLVPIEPGCRNHRLKRFLRLWRTIADVANGISLGRACDL